MDAGEEEVSKRSNEDIRIEIWDYKLFNSFRGGVSVPLREVMKRRKVKSTYTLEGVSHGDLTLELRWFGVLDQE